MELHDLRVGIIGEHPALAGCDARKHLAGTDGRVRQDQLALEACLQTEQPVEVGGGEEAVEVHARVMRADTINSAVSLDYSHGVPGQIVIDDAARLLEIDSFGKDIGGQEEVVFVVMVAADSVRCEFPECHRPFDLVDTGLGPENRFGLGDLGSREVDLRRRLPLARPRPSRGHPPLSPRNSRRQ